MYTVGGLDVYVHKYMGPKPKDTTNDVTQPAYPFADPTFVEDLLLIENRDRVYDPDVYVMRMVYNTQDVDFDLSQFGLFLNNDTLFLTTHYNQMIDTFGRKLMAGDVLELPNLKDYNPLNTDIPAALPRYYVIQDAAFASEGFSQTWLPHLWRVKATPLVGAQEYNDILKKPFGDTNYWDNGNYYPSGSKVQDGDKYYQAITDVPPGTDIGDPAYWEEYTPQSIQEVQGTRKQDYILNDAILAQAQVEMPLVGYDVVKFYVLPTNPDGTPADPYSYTADSTAINVSSTGVNVGDGVQTPRGDGYTRGYLTGDGYAPNGYPVHAGVQFPSGAREGDFALRLDYFPNRLFRYNGKAWIKIEDDVRTDLTPGPENLAQRSLFVNNNAVVQTEAFGDIPSRQGLSDILDPRKGNG